jgi:hypothetical protein
MKLKLVISCVIIILLVGCTIQKRHYSNGFYFNWNKTASTIQKVKLPIKENSSALANADQSKAPIDTTRLSATTSDIPFQNKPELTYGSSITKTKSATITQLDTITPNEELPPDFTPEQQKQLDLDRHRMNTCWFAMTGSVVLFLGSLAILLQVDIAFFYLTFFLGMFGVPIFFILALVFLGKKGAHELEYSEQLALDEKKKEDPVRAEEELKAKSIS